MRRTLLAVLIFVAVMPFTWFEGFAEVSQNHITPAVAADRCNETWHLILK